MTSDRLIPAATASAHCPSTLAKLPGPGFFKASTTNAYATLLYNTLSCVKIVPAGWAAHAP